MGEPEAGEASDGVREGGKIYLTHTGLDKEHHVIHLEPEIGRGGEEEAGVREGGQDIPDPHRIENEASCDPPGARDWTRRHGR